MSKNQKRILVLASAFALTFGIVPTVSAMHIMEGYLPGGFCIAWVSCAYRFSLQDSCLSKKL